MILYVKLWNGAEAQCELTKTKKGWEQRIVPHSYDTSQYNVDYVSYEKVKDLHQWWAIDFKEYKIVRKDV